MSAATFPHNDISLRVESTMLDAFWKFVSKRQHIFTLRRIGAAPPWTDDPTLAAHRFTNVYRAADRVSQFLISEVIQSGDQDPIEVMFRCVLFRIFNLPETYLELRDRLGATPSLLNWDVARYAHIIDQRQLAGYNTWSGAYIMRTPAGFWGQGRGAKTKGWLYVLDGMLHDCMFERIATDDNLERAVALLQTAPTVGPFLAMQYATDIGYSDAVHWDENDYIQPGLGALRGARRLLVSQPAESVMPALATTLIYRLAAYQRGSFTLRDLPFDRLGDKRDLSAIDVQNCLCEFDKWCREHHPETNLPGEPTRIKQSFNAVEARQHAPIIYRWPTRWNLED